MKFSWPLVFLICLLRVSDAANSTSQVTLTPSEQYAVFAIRSTISFLSLFGSVFIITSILLFKKYRQMSSRLILALTASALLDAISNLLSLSVFRHEEELFSECFAQGIISQVSQVSCFGWITVIAINLYLVVVRSVDTEKLEKIYHLVVWIFALACMLIPLASPGSYGPAGMWCWITWDVGQPYRWVFFYVPLMLMLISVAITYSLIIATITTRIQESSDEAKEKGEKLRRRLMSYPIIFVCCWIFPIINRIYDAASSDDSFFLFFMHGLSEPTFGLLNAIAYGVSDPEIRRLWAEQFAKMGFCAACRYPYDVEEDDEEADTKNVSDTTNQPIDDNSEVSFANQNE